MSTPSAPQPAEDSLWDAKDVARYMKASVSWAYKAAERDEIPCIRIGAMLRFEPAAIRAWLVGAHAPGYVKGASK